jgi:hypothetical protein
MWDYLEGGRVVSARMQSRIVKSSAGKGVGRGGWWRGFEWGEARVVGRMWMAEVGRGGDGAVGQRGRRAGAEQGVVGRGGGDVKE